MSGPSIFWSSDPAAPAETVLIVGHDLDAVNRVEIELLADTPSESGVGGAAKTSLLPSRQTPQTLYFSIPSDWRQGVYRYRLEGEKLAASGVLNRPVLYWSQGEAGALARPGRELRLFGRNLGLTPGAMIRLKTGDGREVARAPLPEASLWTATAKLPSTLAPGSYLVSVWNGRGDASAWSEDLAVDIEAPPAAGVERQLSVRDFGAKGDGTADDSAAIEAGLAAAAERGAVLLAPPGRYLLKHALHIPNGATLRGVDRDLSSLLWPEFETPPESLVSGDAHFAIEDMTLYASNHRHVISGGFEAGVAPKGDIHLRRIRIRASAYRGHIAEGDVHRRESALKTGVGGPNGGAAIRLRGDGLEIADSDIYASGSALFVLDSRRVAITGNSFYNGRGGWYSISGCRDAIIEGNEFVGADLGASGGGVNTLFSTGGSSENIWLAKNKFRLMHAWDREAMTTDGPGGSYYGHIVELAGRRLTLDGALTPGSHSPIRQGVFILAGRGAGQFAQIVDVAAGVVTLDRDWTVAPDRDSLITIVPMVQRYLIVGNEFSDAGAAVQLYGTSVEQVIAENSSARTAGFLNQGRWYHHFQPSWYIQYLKNRIVDGTVYRGGPDGMIFSGEAVIGAYGLPHPQSPPLTLGIVMRGNQLVQNARIEIGGCGGAAPLTRGLVVEHNNVLTSTEPVKGVGANCDAVIIPRNEKINPFSKQGAK
ncbi:glycosyl hydrolase family 28-related protein [Methylosinus sp. sav-2]|uniref:glycosyl hydrolase family 28-related protein n=1 Tax=Methylosinus sp. sav-2 TaxID=2485168 RepID=UPI00047EFD8F|nr:glycosyl hydrolase family 28-related protein [Methylosinus sp. sav-2]